ncbi:MAG: hypothetical protein O3C27_04300, partial [Actinomycetota bacterium]|nr:hypothetical protein [Actinomycetota bacterium]
LSMWPSADATTFSPAQHAALAMADQLGAVGELDDATWASLHRHFGDRGCLELVLTTSFYACVSRVLNGLQVPLEPENAGVPAIGLNATTPHLGVDLRSDGPRGDGRQ